MILAQNLYVSYGEKNVISNLDFSAIPGKVTAIIGPNGSGKTTLLNALCGDIKFSGTALINGLHSSHTAAWQLAEQRAVLTQFSTVTFPFTVREIVRLGILQKTRDANDDRQLIEQALKRVGLSGFANRYYLELSGGEQQRVQLARVLCQVWQPVSGDVAKWLFLDEPVSSLDIQHQLKIMNISRDYAKQGGGVVAIMHDLNLTAMYADKIYIMKNGTVSANGSPEEVLQDKILEDVFGCCLRVNMLPKGDTSFILPQAIHT